MTALTAAGPAGTAHNPFAGTGAVPGPRVEFPADRYVRLGATDEEVDELSAYFSALTRDEQRDAAAWHDEVEDEELTASLGRFRELRDALLALGGLPEAERLALEALSEDERDALAEYVAQTAEAEARALDGLTDDDRAALAALSDDDRAALSALSEDDRAALRATTVSETPETEQQPDGDSSAEPVEGAPAETPEAAPAETDAPGGAETTTEQQPEETRTFTTKDIADLTIAEVEALVAAGTVTAGDALLAEQARADKARPRLIERLRVLDSATDDATT